MTMVVHELDVNLIRALIQINFRLHKEAITKDIYVRLLWSAIRCQTGPIIKYVKNIMTI